MRALIVILAALLLGAAPAVAAPELDGVSGPSALATADLAGEWAFTPARGEKTTIEVPGGGWYKQGFDVPSAVYERTIAVPAVEPGQVTKIELGAVNHEATMYVDDKLVGTKTTSYMLQHWDISD